MALPQAINDKTLLNLCKCRNALLNKLKTGCTKEFDKDQELCLQFDCESHRISSIINKLRQAKENLTPVIEEIITHAAKLNKTDFNQLKYKNGPICSVTTAQFAGAVEASKLLYEVNADLNEYEKMKKKKTAYPCKNISQRAEFALNAFVYPQTEITCDGCDRIYIDRDLMQQLIELHELLGETINRLRVRESGYTSGFTTRTASTRSSRPYCTMGRTPPTGSSKTSLRPKSPHGSPTDVNRRECLCPPLCVTETPRPMSPTYEEEQRKTKSCCADKSKGEMDAKKKAKQEAKLQKQLEKQRKKELKKREKEAKKCLKKKKSKSYNCCGKTRSQSATYVREGTLSNVNNIDEAKQKILDCLKELCSIRCYLNQTSRTELDFENQLEIIGNAALGPDCCERKFPHIHATLNGIPIVLQLNQDPLSMLPKKPSSKTVTTPKTRCRCGPVELDSCPLETLVNQQASKTSIKSLIKSLSKTKSLPSVVGKRSLQQMSSVQHKQESLVKVSMEKKGNKSVSEKKVAKDAVSSSVIYKAPNTLGSIMSSSLSNAEILATPETSLTVFSTKKTKDGQKVRLTLTISPVGTTAEESKVSSKVKSKQTSSYKHVVPERESVFQKSKPDVNYRSSRRRDGFETDESDPGMPYIADNTSLPNFTVDEQRTRTTLIETGICHPNQNIQKELEEMGLDNLLRACRPAKCCRKTVINEKPRNALPYPASLMSLPLDREDIIRIRADIKRSNSKYINYYQYKTLNFETYTNFQRDDKLPWKIPRIVEVRFFELFRMDRITAEASIYRSRKHHDSARSRQTSRKCRIKENFPFYKYIFPFNVHLFDILRKKQYKNSDAQTIDDVVSNDIKAINLVTPTKYKKLPSNKSQLKTTDGNRKEIRGVKNFLNISEQRQENIFPYKQEDVTCYRTEKVSHKVHFEAAGNTSDATHCDSTPSPTLQKEKISSVKIQKSVNDLVSKDMEDSLIKLIPLQPYLVERILEDKTRVNSNDRSSKSVGHKSSVNTIDSRIIYKRHQSEDLYYITSKTFDKTEQKGPRNSFTSMCKSSIFYPFKPPEYMTYYNTILTGRSKSQPSGSHTLKKNANKPCDCRNVSAFHTPEGLEDLMIDGRVPCLCSRCDIACKELDHGKKLYDKLVNVDSNESLGDVDKRNKRTIIRSGKIRHHKSFNSKLVDDDRHNMEHIICHKWKTDQSTGTIDERFERKSRNFNRSCSRDRSKLNLDAYSATTDDLTRNVATRKKPKCNLYKETATSKQSFVGPVHKYKHRDETEDESYSKSDNASSCSKPSFHFQCEDEDTVKSKVNKRPALISRLPVVMKKKNPNDAETNATKKKRQGTTRSELPIVTNSCKNVINYITPRDDRTLSSRKAQNVPSSDPELKSNTQNMSASKDSSLASNDSSVHGCTRTESLCAPLINKNAILNSKGGNNNKIADRKAASDKPNATKCGANDDADNVKEVTGFKKMIENLKKDLSYSAYQAQSNNSKPIERCVKHTFSEYRSEVDGQSRPGYLSILKPTCGCPEITVFIPCYCDDNTIFGREKKST